MPLQVDDRAGSIDIVPLLRRLAVQVEVTRLPFGDVAFLGLSQDGAPINVGIEIKTLADVLACVQSGRFAGHQLPGMIASYDHLYLLIQGVWRPRVADGVLEEYRHGRHGGMYWTPAGGGHRQWRWRDLESWLMTIGIMGGLRVHRVPTWDEGAMWLKTLYGWYQKDEHKSHLVMYSSKELYADTAMMVKPPLVRRLAAELPGVGLKRSAAVASNFKTVKEMIDAPEAVWVNMMIDGDKRFGVRGSVVYKALRGGNNGK